MSCKEVYDNLCEKDTLCITSIACIQKEVFGSVSAKCDQGSNDLKCRCDRPSHVGFEIKDLGQHKWACVSKQQFTQIDIKLLSKCHDLLQFIAQQEFHTEFIPLSPLQFLEVKNCNKCVVAPDLCRDPVKLYNHVSSFKCPNV